jgi:hypothetical protein
VVFQTKGLKCYSLDRGDFTDLLLHFIRLLTALINAMLSETGSNLDIIQ